jgi:light-regulated signal transduction histidine kinase (bacteriophytochrome)
MKCNPLNIGDGLFLYVGYPILTGGVSLRDYGLTISDLPQHDAVMEFLFIMEGMKRSLFESEQYLNQVTEMNNRLDYLVKVRTQQLEVAHEELEAFVRTISHDLRSPLRLINSFATLVLEDSVSIKPDKIEMLQLIKKSSDNMGNIISDLLSLAKVNHSTPRKSHVDVKQLVLDILREVKHTGIYETSFTNIVVADLAGLQGDKGLIRLVFQNLINNAIKYSSKTAHPAIEIGMLQTEQSEMVYYVKDNGVGFNSEEASQLFKPFQRMHSQSEFDGTGIGLSIVKAIMNKHNGRVWAQSSENMGATFYLAFPPND